jgi:hypothetical protein
MGITVVTGGGSVVHESAVLILMRRIDTHNLMKMKMLYRLEIMRYRGIKFGTVFNTLAHVMCDVDGYVKVNVKMMLMMVMAMMIGICE